MKCKLILIYFFIISSLTFAQDPPSTAYFEIYTYVEDQTPDYPYQNYDSVKFWMNTSHIVWDWDHTATTFDIQAMITSVDWASACHKDNPDIVSVPIGHESGHYGIYHVLTNWYIEDRTFGYGLYNFYIGYEFDDPLLSFRLDYRDCDLGGIEDGTTIYPVVDIWIKYFPSQDSAVIDWDDSDFTSNVTAVENNKRYKIWKEKTKQVRNNIQNTDYFELLLKLTNHNGNPKLTWNPYHDYNLGYYIYKKLTTSSGTRTDKIFTTSTTYTDTDFDIDIKFGDDHVEYWVRAKVIAGGESLPSNHVSVDGDSYIQWKRNNATKEKEQDYQLKQSFPNPFNPSTTISYSLAKKGYTVLNIYNTLGQEVSRLVDEFKSAGNYSVEFDASNIPSGVYFYKIQSGDFVDVKKMILMK